MMYSSRDIETFEISSFKLREKKQKNSFFGHFRLSEAYKYLRTFIVNPFLLSFWGINQFFTTGSSRDTENHAILSLKSPQKQKIIFLGNFRLSKGYTYLRPPVVNQVLLLFWVVRQLSTTSGSRDMDFW